MSYAIKEIFYTLQGEGANTGRPAVFCRFAGCNLWSGRESDRASAICRFCDTDFVGTDGPGGNRYRSAADLALAVASHWPKPADRGSKPLVVCTGGEPLLQLDDHVISELHRLGFEIALETNGTLPVPAGVDWICVSPKAKAPLIQRTGHELKLIFPQLDAPPEEFVDLEFAHFFLQPMDGPGRDRNTATAIQYCLENPRWRLSLQTHKFLGIP